MNERLLYDRLEGNGADVYYKKCGCCGREMMLIYRSFANDAFMRCGDDDCRNTVETRGVRWVHDAPNERTVRQHYDCVPYVKRDFSTFSYSKTIGNVDVVERTLPQ